ncbi:TIGR02391 family protein [Candidatus Spongiihabitans sp.]|uniref:TIGR02391 family protein n=1 Tax=Candidatus Spongiihabitans sp. TaxID=3101308 RepID=UPI003C6F6DF6
MSQNDKQLTMTFDPKVIEHLGIRMYSTLPPVLSELISNSYDADATRVEVELHDVGEKRIIVKDNGMGMSFNDIDNKFLIIGRNRRKDGEGITHRGREVIGKKGLGKLSFFGIVQTITINTVKQKKRNIFTMDWNDLMNSSEGKYLMTPEVVDEIVEGDDIGTKITLTNINRASDFSEELLASSIARFFIFEEDFAVTIRRNDGEAVTLSNDMRFSAFGEEFSWDFPDDFTDIESDYEHVAKIQGKIITPEKPIAPRFDSRGISLFARGKLVQTPYQFADSTSSHFFSYMTGWLKVDFIEDFLEDVISTNRQNLNWGHLQMSELHKYLGQCVQFVQVDWRKKRKDEKFAKVSQNLGAVGIEDWKKSMPENMKNNFEIFIKKLIEDLPEVESDKSVELFTELKELIPPYPYYHWRNLHPLIKERLYEDYKSGKYLEAAREGTVVYDNKVKRELNLQLSGVDLMNQAFNFKYEKKKGKIEITNYPKLQVSKLSSETEINIQHGQRSLSVGLMQAFRNPESQETREILNKLFIENDCLNILSLVSFLLYRLDNVKKNG